MKEPKSTKEMRILANKITRKRGAVSTLNRKLKVQKEELRDLENEFLGELLDQKIQSFSTSRSTLAVKRTTFADISDEKKFFKYVAKTGGWDLIRKQVNVGAARERWELDEKIPGVEPGTRHALSVTKKS